MKSKRAGQKRPNGQINQSVDHSSAKNDIDDDDNDDDDDIIVVDGDFLLRQTLFHFSRQDGEGKKDGMKEGLAKVN